MIRSTALLDIRVALQGRAGNRKLGRQRAKDGV